MKIWDAIREMRRLSKENTPFSFTYMSYSIQTGHSEGVVHVRRARLLQRESLKFNQYAEDMERYLNLDTGEARHFWQPLLMSFDGEKTVV